MLHCRLLKNHVEPRVGRDRNADILRIRGVHQFLFARKRDVAGHAIAQECLAGDGPVQTAPTTNDVCRNRSDAG